MGAGTIAPKLRLGGLDVPDVSHQYLSYAGNVTPVMLITAMRSTRMISGNEKYSKHYSTNV